MKIPVFNGQMKIEEVLDWISEIDRFFDCMEVSESRQVKLVAMKLKGTTSVWWDQLVATQQRQRKRPIQSRRKMKKFIRDRFLPTDFERILFSQYQNYRQHTRSVEDYTMEFHRLVARNDLNESEDQCVARYVGGLKVSIQEKIQLHMIFTLTDAINMETCTHRVHNREVF